jgi:hypothetical protein
MADIVDGDLLQHSTRVMIGRTPTVLRKRKKSVGLTRGRLAKMVGHP